MNVKPANATLCGVSAKDMAFLEVGDRDLGLGVGLVRSVHIYFLRGGG